MRKLNFQKIQFISIAIIITLVFSVFGSAKAAPTLTTSSRLYWNTFLGGPGYDTGFDIVVDSNDYIYVVGASSGYCIWDCSTFTDPTWGSPLNPHSGGEGDGFIAKLSPNGALIWNTFLGGSDRDVIQDIVLDENGNIYVAGAIYNNTGSLIQFQDGFVAKLNSSGELIWNILLDGALTSIDLDEDGNIFVTGSSEGDWSIVDAPLNSHSGDNDVFIAKLTPSGDFSWYTFFGGTARDGASEIIISDNGNINVVGTSYGTWGTPIRAFVGDWSAFVAELDSSGSLIWNTFLGGGRTSGDDIDVDDSENVYVVGTSWNSWGTPIRAFESPMFQPLNGYVAKLNTNGSLIWNTFLGNGSNESYAVEIDDDGYLYTVGLGCGSWGEPFNSSGCIGDLVKLENTGELIINGYLGSEDLDYSVSLFVKDSQNVFVMGFSESTWGNPIRPTHYESAPFESSPTNVSVAKLNLDTTDPTVNTMNRVGTNPSNMLNVSYQVTFSENVTGVDVADFALDTTGVAGAFVSNVSGSGNTRVVSVNTGLGSTGTIRLDFIDNDTVTDLAGNPITSEHEGDETYTIQKAVLPAPILRSPRSTATLNDTTPNLVWQRVAKATQYEIQIANDENFTVNLLTDTTNSTTYTPSTLSDGIYYWRVRAIDVSGGAGKWSQVRLFTIDTIGPAAPTLTSPIDGYNSSSRSVTFRWQSSSGAVSYQFAYDNDVNCTSPTRIVTVRSTSTRMTLPSGTYYWCVKAKDAFGNWGNWSTSYLVTIP